LPSQNLGVPQAQNRILLLSFCLNRTCDMTPSRARNGVGPRNSMPRWTLLLAGCLGFALLLAGTARAATPSRRDNESIESGHHQKAKRAPEMRAPDGCPINCGMIRDAFASGQCELRFPPLCSNSVHVINSIRNRYQRGMQVSTRLGRNAVHQVCLLRSFSFAAPHIQFCLQPTWTTTYCRRPGM